MNNNKKDAFKTEQIVKFTPDEIDSIIKKWNETKNEAKRLRENEEKYKLVLGKIMDNYNTDIIKGSSLKVSRYQLSRKFLLKENIPKDIYDKYSTSRNITCFRLSKNKE